MLKAVILSGGRGVRLRPLTDNLPKPMIKIRGRPFLQYQIELLKKNGIAEILICVGYLREKIIDYFGNGLGLNVNIEYSIEKDFLGTAGALKAAKDRLPESFILLYGDSYLPIDYIELVNFWSGLSNANLVVCYDNRDKIAQNNIFLDQKGFISRYDKLHPDKEMNYVESGVMILEKEILDIIPDGQVVSLEEEVFPVLISQGRLRGYPVSQRYYDIGTQKGLAEIEGALK